MFHFSLPRAHNMQLFGMLPKNGLYYKFLDDDDEDGKSRKTRIIHRILPPSMSTRIMIQLHGKYKKATKKDFDHAIADLFNNATPTVYKLASSGKNPSCNFDFWHAPKIGTIFENLSDKTTYRFAIKLLEARDRWDERQRTLQNISQGLASHECQAAKAIDRFNDAVEAAAVAGGGLEDLMAGGLADGDGLAMKSYMIDQFNQLSDTDEDDLGGGPARPPAAAKRAKLEEKGATVGGSGSSSSLAVGTFQVQLPLRGCVPRGLDDTEDGNMSGTGDYDVILAQLAMEDQAQLDEEEMMEIDGN